MKRRIFSLFFVFILSVSLLTSYISPYIQVALAQADSITIDELIAYDLMKQWPEQTSSGGSAGAQCNTSEFDRGTNSQSGFAKRIRQGDVDDTSFFGYFQGPQDSRSDILVGDGVPGNHDGGRLGCHAVFEIIATKLFGDRKATLAALYDLDNKDGDEYKMNKHDEGNTSQFLNAKISGWIKEFEARSDFKTKLKTYTNINVKAAFANCWKPKSNREDGYDIYDKGNYASQNENTATGYIVETAAQGNYTDGKTGCDAIFDYVKKNKLLDTPSAEEAAAEEALKNDQDEAVADANGSDEEGTTEISDCSDKHYGWNPKNWIPNALDWFGCTVAKALLSVLKSASDWIADNLETTATTSSDVKKVTESNGTVVATTSQSSKADNALKAIWSNILNIANVLFVIAFLIMIISTALGIGVFDAYTVKKFLPRIIIAAIAANLSWSIAQTMISITNALGGGLHEVIMGPIKTIADSDSQIQAAMGAGTGGMLAGIITAATIPAIVAVVNGGIFVLVPAVMALLFAALTAIVIIMVRKLIIFGLIITAPLAITMWAIPGLDKWAGRWWKMFVQMLMVYPYIMGLFALGEFASLLILITNPSKSSNPIPGLTAIALLAAPLFMLPTVFKMASSTLGNLTGMINNKGKGIFDRGSNWGKERAQSTGRNQYKKQKKEHAATHRLHEFQEGRLERKTEGTGAYLRGRRKNMIDKFGRAKSWRSRMKEVGDMSPEERSELRRMSLSDDDKVARAQLEQYKMRGLNAENATIEMSTKSAALMAKQVGEAAAAALGANADSKSQHESSLDAIENLARQYAKNGNQEGFNAIIAHLANQKGDKQLNRLQQDVAQGSSLDLSKAWTGALAHGSTYSDMRGLSPHYIAQVQHGMNQIEPDALLGAQAKAIEGASANELATMMPSGWAIHQNASSSPHVTTSLTADQLEAKINDSQSAKSAYKGQRLSAPGSYVGGTSDLDLRKKDWSKYYAGDDPNDPRPSGAPFL